jgi:hypothetical protein
MTEEQGTAATNRVRRVGEIAAVLSILDSNVGLAAFAVLRYVLTAVEWESTFM